MDRTLRWLIIYVASLTATSVILIPMVWLLVGRHAGLLPSGSTQSVLALSWVIWLVLPVIVASRALDHWPYGAPSRRR
jgi:hypothetical protein